MTLFKALQQLIEVIISENTYAVRQFPKTMHILKSWIMQIIFPSLYWNNVIPALKKLKNFLKHKTQIHIKQNNTEVIQLH